MRFKSAVKLFAFTSFFFPAWFRLPVPSKAQKSKAIPPLLFFSFHNSQLKMFAKCLALYHLKSYCSRVKQGSF